MVELNIKCLEVAEKNNIDPDEATYCEGERKCEGCPYNFEGEINGRL